MTLTISRDNSDALATKEDSPTEISAMSIKKAWSAVAKRFWEYTEAAGESDTSSFKGLL